MLSADKEQLLVRFTAHQLFRKQNEKKKTPATAADTQGALPARSFPSNFKIWTFTFKILYLDNKAQRSSAVLLNLAHLEFFNEPLNL